MKRSGTSRRRATVGLRDGGDESDESDSDESSLVGSPAIGPHLAQGTARTRGMRGAATAAHAALRANLGQSATPEPHHEPRVSSRRRDYREETPEEPERLVVTLKISREKFRQFIANGSKVNPNVPSSAAVTQATSQRSTPQVHTPTLNSTPTPSQTHQARLSSAGRPGPIQHLGAIEASNPPQPGVPGVRK